MDPATLKSQIEKNKLQPNSPAMTNEEEQKDYLFFNVMPKAKEMRTGQIVRPSLKIPEETSGFLEKKSLFQKYKIILLTLGIVIILSPLGYYFVNKYLKNAYREEKIIVDQSSLDQSKEKPTSTSEEKLTFATSKEWQKKYFNSEICEDLTVCGDEADPDRDGLTNLEEFKLETDPNNNDSDQDGFADGDEVNVFNTNPLKTHTAGNPKYSDADFMRGGYDIQTDKKMTEGQIKELKDKMDQKGLHQPTLTTLGDALSKIYHFGETIQQTPTATSTPANLDLSLEAKQDRDAQRSNTIKNIEIALIKYQTDNKTFPKTQDFKEMHNQIKPYLKVATNPEDPINKEPFIYTYVSTDIGDDFTLTFYSEVAAQLIKKHSSDAQKDKTLEEANIYDDQRKNDLQTLRSALLLYSAKNVAGNQEYVFPSVEKYKTELVPTYLTAIPKDPKTQTDYEYKVNETFDTFTLKTVLDNPSNGTTGYLCNQEECRAY